MKPNYLHDCTKCLYMGTTGGHEIIDWYMHDNSFPLGPTIIARYGDDGAAYSSYPSAILNNVKLCSFADSPDLRAYSEQQMLAAGVYQQFIARGKTTP